MPHLYPLTEPGGPPAPPVPLLGAPVHIGGACVRRYGDKDVLFTRGLRSALVNGRPVAADVRVLAHRDRIHAGPEGWRYSAEDPRRVEPLPAGTVAVCPRCRQPIEPSTQAVRCPCGNWFHHSEKLACFEHAPTCPVCPRKTTLAPAGEEED